MTAIIHCCAEHADLDVQPTIDKAAACPMAALRALIASFGSRKAATPLTNQPPTRDLDALRRKGRNDRRGHPRPSRLRKPSKSP
ncbi:MAG: hypothetical protein AAFV62_01635 [Pseudomonadota bacterium]